MSAGLALLVTILVIFLVAYGAFWLIDMIGLPHPMNMIAKAIVAIVALVYLLQTAGMM